jgi:hypothetical protein
LYLFLLGTSARTLSSRHIPLLNLLLLLSLTFLQQSRRLLTQLGKVESTGIVVVVFVFRVVLPAALLEERTTGGFLGFSCGFFGFLFGEALGFPFLERFFGYRSSGA